MSFASRVKRVEKKAGEGDGTVQIRVADYGSTEVEQDYAKYRARKALGIRPTDREKQTRFIVWSDTEAKYQNMTPEQAKKILKGN